MPWIDSVFLQDIFVLDLLILINAFEALANSHARAQGKQLSSGVDLLTLDPIKIAKQ